MAKRKKATVRGRGRPPTINTDKVNRAISAMRLAGYYESAAAAAGVSRDCFRKWMRRGEAELERVKGGTTRSVRKDEQLYVDLVVGMEKAAAEAQLLYLGTIRAAGDGLTLTKTVTKTKVVDGTTVTETTREERTVRAWQAHAWILERRWPDKWGTNRQDDNRDEEPLHITFDDAVVEGADPDEDFTEMLPQEDR